MSPGKDEICFKIVENLNHQAQCFCSYIRCGSQGYCQQPGSTLSLFQLGNLGKSKVKQLTIDQSH